MYEVDKLLEIAEELRVVSYTFVQSAAGDRPPSTPATLAAVLAFRAAVPAFLNDFKKSLIEGKGTCIAGADEFTVADISVYDVLRNEVMRVAPGVLEEGWPELVRFVERVERRPAIAEWLTSTEAAAIPFHVTEGGRGWAGLIPPPEEHRPERDEISIGSGVSSAGIASGLVLLEESVR